MALMKMIAASAAGALMFTSSALGASPSRDGQSKDTNVSSAQCTVIAIGYSEGKNQELSASAAASAAAYICDGTGSNYDIATQTASAYASAVASVVANCVLVGDSSAQVHAVAEAKGQAEIWVSSYFEAIANAANCETCEAWAYSWGYISKWVFLEAIAKAEVKLDVLSTTRKLKPITFAVQDFKSDVQKVVVTAFADALASAYDYNKEDGCIAWVNAGGCIWTEGHPDEQRYCADCSAGAFSDGSVDSIDAIAEAAASAAAWTCGDSVAIADVEVTAQALAKASAQAFSLAYASCSVDEGGFVCGSAGSEISEWVEAVVRAWAGAWAEAYDCEDKCDVNVDAVVDAVAHILVDAATDAYTVLCAESGEWQVIDLEEQISEKSLCAVAEAAAQAIASPDSCLAAGIVYADAGPGTCPPP